MLTRRALIVAAAALPTQAGAAPSADDALAEALDRAFDLAKAGEAAEALALLGAVVPDRLSPARRWELVAIREGLAREAAMAARPPTGPAAYEATLSLAYGGPVDPHGAHRLALAACRRLQARADRLLRGQGLTAGNVSARLRTLATDPRGLYPDNDAGRDRAVAEMNTRLVALAPRLRTALGDLPVARAAVRRMSAADEAAGRGGYREPPSGGAPGAYYLDLKTIVARPAWTLPSAAFHEVIPGHLMQMPLEAAARPHPLRLRYAGAAFEAWAVYAEQLAADLGAYADDPLGELGFLQWRLFRLGRVVVDTGLHAQGWSRARAVAEMTALQGQSIAFITIEADIDRIAKAPGKVAAEGLGALALSRLRPQDRRRWPGYHRAVLADGPWPFGVLERIVRG